MKAENILNTWKVTRFFDSCSWITIASGVILFDCSLNMDFVSLELKF